MVSGEGGGTPAVEEAEFAADFDLLASAQIKVAHLGKAGRGQNPGGRVGCGAVLHVDVSRRRQFVDQADASGRRFVEAFEVARVVGVDTAVVVHLKVDMVVAQAGQ
ncbi:hypothetical protein D3C79_835420 [compost metagenome]